MNNSVVLLLLLLVTSGVSFLLYWVLGISTGNTAKIHRFQNWTSKRPTVFAAKNVLSFAAPSSEIKAPEIQSVLDATFTKQRLMNKEEFGLFVRLETMFRDHPKKLRLFSQVSLGEILYSESRPAFFAINNKRCDFVVIDSFGFPSVVIEYQGRGHFQGNSADRDQVKRLALKKADIPTVEVLSEFNWADVEKEILLHI